MTPGSWTVRKNAAGWFVDGDGGIPIARATNNYSPAIVAANVRLMAAAPDLLAALREITLIPNQTEGPDWEEIEEARSIARSAIAKATGEP